jgi:hypothetical protein
MRPECSRFIQELEAGIYRFIERLIDTIGSLQISTDERAKLYTRFLARFLARHKRDGATHGRVHQLRLVQVSPCIPPRCSNRKQRIAQVGLDLRQVTGVSGPSMPDLPLLMALNSGVTVPDESTGSSAGHQNEKFRLL